MPQVPDDVLKPVLPKNGQLIVEDSQEFIMSKPRLIPLKSYTLEKLEKMQQEVKELQERTVVKSAQEN